MTINSTAPEATAKPKVEKPPKPRPDFPLFPHLSKQWAKTIGGKTVYFGTWDNPAAAEAEYLRRFGKPDTNGVTLRRVLNAYIEAKQAEVHAGELSGVTLIDYDAICRDLVRHFGPARTVDSIRPVDFSDYVKALARYAPSRRKKMITVIKTIFRFAYTNELITAVPNFGPNFKSPKMRVIRILDAEKDRLHGLKVFQADDIRRLLIEADEQLEAAILLGLNCALGNRDLSELPISALDLAEGWLTFSRTKTGIHRRVPLWPETIAACKAVIGKRREGLVFRSESGRPLVTFAIREVTNERTGLKELRQLHSDRLCKNFGALLNRLGLKRKRLGYYSLRHTAATVGANVRDREAVAAILGHSDGSMTARYIHAVSDERLKAVTDHVRAWLFGETL